VEAIVGDYFDMLRCELSGLAFNKTEHNDRLRHVLKARSRGSVEFKHANTSAILTLHGYPYIDGYKPRYNFQALLEQVVLEYLPFTLTSSSPLFWVRSSTPSPLPIPGTSRLSA